MTENRQDLSRKPEILAIHDLGEVVGERFHRVIFDIGKDRVREYTVQAKDEIEAYAKFMEKWQGYKVPKTKYVGETNGKG